MNKTIELSIRIHKNFKIPSLYQSDAIDDIQDALWIGAQIQQSVKAYRSDGIARELQNTYETKLQEMKQSRDEREAELTREREGLDAKYITALKQARIDVDKAVRHEFEESIRSLEQQMKCNDERRKAIEESRKTDIEEAIAQKQIAMERVITEKEREIARLDAAVRGLGDSIVRQTEEIRTMGAAMTKRIATANGGGNVRIKGSLFENEFHERLVEAYGTVRDFDIRDTARGGGHEGDSIMTIEGEQIMWELKDYSSDVPKKEVDKFLRDMRDYRGAKIGIMVSKTTGISGKHGAITLEINDGRLFIYINRYDEWEAGGCIGGGGLFHILLQLFRVWWKLGSALNSEDKVCDTVTTALQTRLEESFILVQKYTEDIKARRTEWRTHEGRLREVQRWVGSLLDETEMKLSRIIRCLHEDVDTIEDCSIDTTIFQEATDKRGQEWIQNILKVCSVGDGSIELQELVMLLTNSGNGGKRLTVDTIRDNVRKVIREDHIERQGSKKIIRGLSRKIDIL
jgi:hypothetical protein